MAACVDCTACCPMDKSRLVIVTNLEIYFIWCSPWDSNPQSDVLEASAFPVG